MYTDKNADADSKVLAFSKKPSRRTVSFFLSQFYHNHTPLTSLRHARTFSWDH